MTYSKRFPKDRKGSPFASWEEVYLAPEEEAAVEKLHRTENIKLMRECIKDAEKIFFEEDLKDLQANIIDVAVALFGQRSRHVVYWKEEKAKEKIKEQDEKA